MSINPREWGDLYSDNQTLFPGAEEALKEKKRDLDSIKKQLVKNPFQAERTVLDTYQHMIHDAFDYYYRSDDENKPKLDFPQGVEVYFAPQNLTVPNLNKDNKLDTPKAPVPSTETNLKRERETNIHKSPQDGWKVFVLVEKQDDVKTLTPVFAGLNHFWNRISHEQAFPCPIDANSHHFIGTPQQLFNKLKHGEHELLEKENQYKVEDSVTSVFSARPVFPDSKLGEQLREKILNDPSTAQCVSPRLFYDKCHLTESSKGSDIECTLDYLLMGLRQEFLSSEQEPFTRKGTLKLLRENECIPETDIELIEESYTHAVNMIFEDLENAHFTLKLDPVADINKMVAQRQAVLMWDEANQYLEAGQVENFINMTFQLCTFMSHNKLQKSDLLPVLENKIVTQKGLGILKEIQIVLGDYTNQTSHKENRLLSYLAKLPEFFLNCKSIDSKIPEDLEASSISKSAILITSMHLMKPFLRKVKNSPPAISLPALLDYKMAAIKELENNNNLTEDALNHILSFKQGDLKEPLHYHYATEDTNKARTHQYEVQGEALEHKDYKTLRGDVLKTRILIDFKNRLSEATNKDNLDTIVQELKATPEFDILNTIQGKTGRALEIFGFKTSSVTAFEKMIKDVESTIESAYRTQLR